MKGTCKGSPTPPARGEMREGEGVRRYSFSGMEIAQNIIPASSSDSTSRTCGSMWAGVSKVRSSSTTAER